jgi:hypothetical protein
MDLSSSVPGHGSDVETAIPDQEVGEFLEGRGVHEYMQRPHGEPG